MSHYPQELRYTSDHEWVREEGEGLVVGVTHYAQEALGDIVYVQLPEVGVTVQQGEPFAEIESTKSVSDVYAPLTGTIIRRNDALDAAPEAVNHDPYGDGWLVVMELADPRQLEHLLDADAYVQQLGE